MSIISPLQPSRRETLIAGAALALPGPAMGEAVEGERFYGPFSDWLDARRDFGAAGDGRTDDTAALQAAIRALHEPNSKAVALYIPAGRYRVTKTLVLPRQDGRQAIGLNIQGEDPRRTVLVWDGEVGGVLFDYGAWYSTLGRITFDGGRKARYALDHGPEFVTGNEIADCVFQNAEVGIRAGRMANSGIAETSLRRCRFLACSTAGASLENWNSLDVWFWRCWFEDCGIGLTNVFGAGNFHAYDSTFLRSRFADIEIRNTGFLSFRDNLSIGSKAFFVARQVEAGAQLTLQRNRIYEAQDQAVIRVGNLGPVTLLDNTIVSRAGGRGAAVVAQTAATVAIGNRLSAGSTLDLKPGSIELDTASAVLGRSGAPSPKPAEPPSRYTGRVIELAAGAPAAAIQAAIASLAKKGGLVRLAAGGYEIDRTLTIPAEASVALVGAGIPYATTLRWTGAGEGPVFDLAAPSRARLADIVVDGGGKVAGLEARGCDAAGGAVWMEGVMAVRATVAGLSVEGLRSTAVTLSDLGHSGNTLGVRILGGGVNAAARPVVIQSGASSDNQLSYRVANGGRLLAKDIWYESSSRPLFLRLDGDAEFTLNGSNIATPRTAGPPVTISGLKGQAVFANVIFTGQPQGSPAVLVEAGGEASKVLVIGCNGDGDYFASRAASGLAARRLSVTYTPGGGAKPAPDVGQVSDEAVKAMLEGLRTTPTLSAPASSGKGRTDLRLRRVYVQNCTVGVRILA